MRNYKIASVLMIIHGGFMELVGCLALVPIVILGDKNMDMAQYFSFIVPYLQDNLILMMVMGGLYGTVRLIGAIALWKNRMWGLFLSVINCIVTMALMIFMLPAGILDGILSCAALILILTGYFGKKEIKEIDIGYQVKQE